jgi:hypothetical protein
MKLGYSIFALALVGAAAAAPVPVESPELVAKDAATYTNYPAPAGGYGDYPAPSGGYGTYPAPSGGYTTYAAPAGGYKTYKKAISDLIARFFS